MGVSVEEKGATGRGCGRCRAANKRDTVHELVARDDTGAESGSRDLNFVIPGARQ